MSWLDDRDWLPFYFPSYAICQLWPYLHKRRKTRRKFAVQLLATVNIYCFPWKKKKCGFTQKEDEERVCEARLIFRTL